MAQTNAVQYPFVFVTGVGQTWTSLRGGDSYRWNLFPRSGKVLLDGLTAAQRRQLASAAAQSVRYLLRGTPDVPQQTLQSAVESLLHWCRADDAGELPLRADVHIYGARSFAELSRIDFYTGEPTDDASRSLLDRLLRDVPCREFMENYGAENMYCFNYSPFTDVYTAAAALRKTLHKIVHSRKEGKVVLIPMSMGAAVTNAYLDAYYTQDGAVGENYIARIVSVVGAWDGSEGFADMLQGAVSPRWNEIFYGEVLPSTQLNPLLLRTLTAHPERMNRLLRQLLDALLDGVLLRSSAFAALITHERWQAMYPDLFSAARFARNSRLVTVQREMDRFIRAQANLRSRMRAVHENCGVEFSFVGGSGLHPGEGSRDFSFMRLLRSADRTDTDGVLQRSSSMPFEEGSDYVHAFAVFDRQPHEIGDNPDAMRLIFDLAAGKGSVDSDFANM